MAAVQVREIKKELKAEVSCAVKLADTVNSINAQGYEVRCV